MKGRQLTNSEFWQRLVDKKTGRTEPLQHRNKLLLLLAGLTGLREAELTLITVGLFISPTGELRELGRLITQTDDFDLVQSVAWHRNWFIIFPIKQLTNRGNVCA